MQSARILLLLILCSSLVLASKIDTAAVLKFRQFVKDYNKQYGNIAEHHRRFQIFQQNLKTIDALNAKSKSATFGVNKFADLTAEEFESFYLMKTPVKKDPSWPVAPLFTPEEIAANPTSWDWRLKGAVTPVKNQGMCGSCWAFSAVGSLEGQWFLAGHPLTGLSEQNLVDCDHECMQYEGQKVCDQGCDGGLMPNAFQYVLDNKGIDTEAGYAYVGFDQNCAYSPTTKGATMTNWTMIASDETQMAAYMVKNGPISIAVDATLWQFYIGGVFDFPWCGSSLDHGVLIVGYNTTVDILDQSIDFWWVKNSWGSDWGYDGYIKLEKGDGECGDTLFPCSAVALNFVIYFK
jgi:cathepsin F